MDRTDAPAVTQKPPPNAHSPILPPPRQVSTLPVCPGYSCLVRTLECKPSQHDHGPVAGKCSLPLLSRKGACICLRTPIGLSERPTMVVGATPSGKFRLGRQAMPTNPDSTWSMPEVMTPCQVDALACVINDYCDWCEGLRPFSRDGVKRLIDLAFYASLQKEEGRSPGFRLFGGSPQGGIRVTFAPPVDVNHTTIRRLAPSITSINHALWVNEKDDVFESRGIVSIVEDRVSTPGCIFNSAFAQTKPGLLVRLLGPGHLRASAGGTTWDWNAGKLSYICHFGFASVVWGWFDDLTSAILKDWPKDALLLQTVSNVWSFMIESVVADGHGGAFVIVPKDPERLIQHKYASSDTSLLDYIREFWESFVRVRSGPTGSWRMEPSNPQLAMRNEHRLRSAAQAMAELANVDGCVVFDRRLQLKGFGGEIQVDTCSETELVVHRGFFAIGDEIRKEKVDGKHQLWNCPCGDREARAKHREDIKAMGTRHLSAIRLCAALPGTLAFVISQDRALSVVFGEKPKHVWLWRSLDASARPLDRE